MGRKYCEEMTVEYYQCNMFGEITLGALVDVMMTTSGNQEKTLPQVAKYLREANYIWVMTQNDIEIKKLPRYKERIRVETEAKEYNAFFTYRQFLIQNERGEVLVTVNTTFSLIDYEQRNIVRIPAEVITGYGASPQQTKPKKVRFAKVLATISAQADYQVEFLDIDANGHVNNTIYLNWLTNALGKAWFDQYRPSHLVIKYEKELMLGDKVRVESDTSSMPEARGTAFKTEHRIVGQICNHSSAQIWWLPR